MADAAKRRRAVLPVRRQRGLAAATSWSQLGPAVRSPTFNQLVKVFNIDFGTSSGETPSNTQPVNLRVEADGVFIHFVHVEAPILGGGSEVTGAKHRHQRKEKEEGKSGTPWRR